ncbi:MAG TPA: VOC family protein [Albitalea sp.]|uniref:VOC family protein n=1 Tax=Piscinibacter sp. TaxID=1903157 RepID=UPI002ED30714
MSRPYGKFIWFEHASNDHAKARAFYEPLFGWHVEAMPMGAQSYPVIHNGSEGIGGLTTPDGGPTRWVSYILVEDVDKVHKAALAAGARQVLPPTDYAPMGRGSALTDPTGAAVSLWTPSDPTERPEPDQVPIGGWYWNELWTPDAAKALAFYEKVCGYTHETMSMGEQGDYHILHAAGQARGGVFQSPDQGTPPMWMPYVHVADCDATAAKAAQLGAKVFMAPTDIPNVGRFAAMFDPLGAAIAFIKGAPQAM